MRRRDKEITDNKKIEEIIRSSQICRLGLSYGSRPYIVPLCFGYKDETLFFHSAQEGKKRVMMEKNPNVCVEFDRHISLVQADRPCSWGMKYQSVIGFGKVEIVESSEEKKEALRIIMQHYSTREFEFDDAAIRNTFIFKVNLFEITGKEAEK